MRCGKRGARMQGLETAVAGRFDGAVECIADAGAHTARGHGTVAIFVPARGQHTLVQPVQPVLGRVGLGCCGGEQQGGGKKGAGEKSHIDLRGWQADA